MIVTVASAERIIVDHAVVIVPPGEYLRGRITPVNGDTMMRLYLGDVVDIVDRIDGWVEIVGGENGTCWVCEEYLVATYRPLEIPVDAVIRSNEIFRYMEFFSDHAVQIFIHIVRCKRYFQGVNPEVFQSQIHNFMPDYALPDPHRMQ
jgi:hypothetical protein